MLSQFLARAHTCSFQYCVNLCRVVTSERNCVCNPCGASPATAPQPPILPQVGTSTRPSRCWTSRQARRAKLACAQRRAPHTLQAYLGELNATTWQLLDHSDPHKGVQLVYNNGQGRGPALPT